MIERLFTILSQSMNSGFTIAIGAAFAWGILSILLSPCHLTSIPLIIGYITNQDETKVKRSFYLSFVFALSILISIALVGLITASLGRLIGDMGHWGNYIIAAIFIIVGLYLMDIVPLNWVGPKLPANLKGYTGAFILGLVFGIGLGPCTFAYMAPVLGVVFDIAGTHIWQAVALVIAFGFGHCSVIVTAGSLTSLVQKYLSWNNASDRGKYIRQISGALIILGGFYFIYTTI